MSAISVDFKIVKDAATPEHVVRFLNLQLKTHGDSLRGPCPICKAVDQRAFAITVSKRMYYCFRERDGGDMLKLVAKCKGVEVREAAIELAKSLGFPLVGSAPNKTLPETGSGTAPPSPSPKGFDAEKYAAGLDPDHAALEPLGLSLDLLRAWKAGFAPTGVNRGRLALPVCKTDGTIVAYCGRAISAEQQPALTFPNGLTPSDYIFGAERVGEGELFLVRDPLDVLRANDAGITNVVSFFTETISNAQLQYLSALMDAKGIDSLSIF